jgi:hypothetical protein
MFKAKTNRDYEEIPSSDAPVQKEPAQKQTTSTGPSFFSKLFSGKKAGEGEKTSLLKAPTAPAPAAAP